MSRDMQALYWRINVENHLGLESLSLLMPDKHNNNPVELPTNIQLRSQGKADQPLDLCWSDEDKELFLSLLESAMGHEFSGNIELDLEDQAVWNFIHLVALSRFKTPHVADEFIAEPFVCVREEVSQGDMLAVHTKYGNPLAVVVGMDSIDISCVLLESIVHQEQTIMPAYSLLMVNRLGVLPYAFADNAVVKQEVVH